MSRIIEIPAEILRDRHRLSSQQINMLCGSRVIEESFEEKTAALEQVAELLRIKDALDEAEIGFIPLKGPLLSLKLYGDATIRQSRDLDILVNLSEVGNVIALLEVNEYVTLERDWPDDKRKKWQLLKYHHDIPLAHSVTGTVIEIHWRLRHRQWLDLSESEMLLKQNMASIEFTGRSFQKLNNEMELLYLVIHGGLHYWGRLKWLVDVDQYMKTQVINWKRFKKLSESFNAGRLVSLCNEMLKEYFPEAQLLPCSASVPAYMKSYARKRITDAVYVDDDKLGDILSRLRFSMEVYPGLSYKIRLISDILFNSGIGRRLGTLLENR